METAAAKEYAIEISNNEKNWTEIGHFKTNRKLESTYGFNNTGKSNLLCTTMANQLHITCDEIWF